jgi:hypothetical protein
MVLVLSLALAGCSALPFGPEGPTPWAPPAEALPPAPLLGRTPLPSCGVIVGIPGREDRRCILEAYEAGRGAELVLELTPEQFVVIRVHPGRRIIVIRNLRPGPSRPFTWFVETCTSLREEVSVLDGDCDEPRPLAMQQDL